MQQDKKRKLVDRIRNVLKSFLEYMKLEVDEDDDEYYEADEDYKVEFTKKEWIQNIITIVFILIVFLVVAIFFIGIVVAAIIMILESVVFWCVINLKIKYITKKEECSVKRITPLLVEIRN